ncbi:MAG: DUF4349 domain-containing protein [Lachnospiraceae bacterium]|nr:DUF4349 domain-containing protein [Lachnospiraceae bacterium]
MRIKDIKLLVALLMASILVTGCGSNSSKSAAYDTSYNYSNNMAVAEDKAVYEAAAEEYDYAEEIAEEVVYDDAGMSEDGMGTLDENTQTQERKLIKTVYLYVETEEYDTLLTNLEQQVTALGGYIEYQYQYNGSNYSRSQEVRNASMEIRIPSGRLDEFVGKVGEQSNITNKEERVEDVTLQYVDLESRKNALKTEQERLLELLEKAETVEDIISIEQRLSEVRYELESMESQLRTMDNQIDYSTVNLNIQEVKRLTPAVETSLLGRIRNGLLDSIYQIGNDIEDGFVWVVINLPYFLIWIVIIVLAILIVRWFGKHRKKKKAAKRLEEAKLLKEAETVAEEENR